MQEIWHPHAVHEVAVWNLVEMMLEINLYELTVRFERCILETERMETQGMV
jgi:hypothetical protein